MSGDIDQTVRELEERVSALRGALGFAHRAFVIEFAGTPKSGKSTSVEAIRHFFTRNGFRVHVLAERAAVCPIPMKGHLFFNTWCASTMLAELLVNVEAEADIIIVDRGLFDALVWLILQEKRGEITDEEARKIESFLLLDRWRKLIDLVVVMNVSAEDAISRENSQRITPKPGSIMNPGVLAAVSGSVAEAYTLYGPQFLAALTHETTGQKIKPSNVDLVDKILARLEPFLDPEILVVPRESLSELPVEEGGCFAPESGKAALEVISRHGVFMRRSRAEVDDEHVQIIPAGILTYKDNVFIFRRKEADSKYRLYGKTTILQATHAVQADGQPNALLEAALFERVARSLHLGRKFPIKLLGYCWDQDDPNSRRHFAMVYEVDINSEHTATDLRKKEFRKWRGPSLAGEFIAWKDLEGVADELNLEAWSRAIVQAKSAAK